MRGHDWWIIKKYHVKGNMKFLIAPGDSVKPFFSVVDESDQSLSCEIYTHHSSFCIDIAWITRQLPIGAGHYPWGGHTDRNVSNIHGNQVHGSIGCSRRGGYTWTDRRTDGKNHRPLLWICKFYCSHRVVCYMKGLHHDMPNWVVILYVTTPLGG